tara:strand:+ start:160 stop:342 length:183 start_codon:yes stop_codon:yes gene_type:complete
MNIKLSGSSDIVQNNLVTSAPSYFLGNMHLHSFLLQFSTLVILLKNLIVSNILKTKKGVI